MHSLRLKNYRCFGDEQIARLAPLTLLVGENSNGKTSFLAMIKALSDLAYLGKTPNFKEGPYDLGSFDEIAHYRGGKGGQAASFEAGFEYAADGASKNVGAFNVVFKKRGTAPFPVQWRLADPESKFWIEHNLPLTRGKRTICIGTPQGQSLERELELNAVDEGTFFPIYFLAEFALHDIDQESSQSPKNGKKQLGKADKQSIRRLAQSMMRYSHFTPVVYASAPVRSKPHRTYDPARVVRDSEGDYIPMYLANEYFENQERWLTLKKQLEEFGKQAGLFDEISITPLGKQGGPFQVQVRRFGGRVKGPQRNLIDVGYGVSQILPVITEMLRPETPPMLLLQQPEVHLHPSAQAALGSLFCQIAKPAKQIIAETHSDHLLDRVRMDVRDGVAALKPEDVSILYFERDGLDVRIHSLGIDENGNINDAPDSYRQFFREEVTRSVWKRVSSEN